MTTDDFLKQGIAALKAGHKAEARNLLTQVVEQDQYNEMAWLWLSGAVEADDDKRTCLENVLAINPNNTAAKRGLAMIQQQQVGQAPQPVLTTLEPTTAQPQPSQPAAPPPSIEANRHPKNVPHTIWSPRSKRKKATRRWAGLDPMLVIGIGGVGLVLVCVVLAGIWWALDSGLLQLGPVVPAAPIPTATPAPVVPPGWTKYTHFTGMFSVYYPPSWEVESEDSTSVTFEAPDFASAGASILESWPDLSICQKTGDDECWLVALTAMEAEAANHQGLDFRLIHKGIWTDGVHQGYMVENALRRDADDNWGCIMTVNIPVEPDTVLMAHYMRVTTANFTAGERRTFTQFVRSIRIDLSGR